ncbi:hypothetical protein DFS34DRAFT_655296, partial [Phlyctochytrium arcticum]
STSNPTLTSFSLSSDNGLKITVCDPQKHGEGSGAFITFTVKTSTTMAHFKQQEMTTRRRFTDFVALNKNVADDYPACVIPPLPGKHRMEYLTGDRFSPEFLEKRRISLQTYMDRLSRHPTLQKASLLRQFLEPGDLVRSWVNPKEGTAWSDFFGDILVNTSTRVKKIDPHFIEFQESVSKFEENLSIMERLYTKLLKRQADIERNMTEFEGCLTTLGVMETQVTGPLTEFSQAVREICSFMKEKSQREEVDFLGSIHDYIAYCRSVKDVLIVRDKKQIDHEELQAYLENSTENRDRTISGRGSMGLLGLLTDKFNNFKVGDKTVARQKKLASLESQIAELKEAVDQSNEIAAAFSHEVVKELELFQRAKIHDLKEILRDYTETQLEFHQKCAKVWEAVIPIIADIKIEEDLEFATHSHQQSQEQQISL